MGATDELRRLLDEFEHECFELRVEASETRARANVVRDSYERIRDEFAGRIAATLGSGECEMVYGEDDHGVDSFWCSECGHRQAATFRYRGWDNIIEPRFCQGCGKAVKQ